RPTVLAITVLSCSPRSHPVVTVLRTSTSRSTEPGRLQGDEDERTVRAGRSTARCDRTARVPCRARSGCGLGGRLVGDVPGRVASMAGPGQEHERRRRLGAGRAAQGDRHPPSPGPVRDPHRRAPGSPLTTRCPRGRAHRAVAGGGRTPGTATLGRGLPLPRRVLPRGDRRTDRGKSGLGTAGLRRRHQTAETELFGGLVITRSTVIKDKSIVT